VVLFSAHFQIKKNISLTIKGLCDKFIKNGCPNAENRTPCQRQSLKILKTAALKRQAQVNLVKIMVQTNSDKNSKTNSPKQ